MALSAVTALAALVTLWPMAAAAQPASAQASLTGRVTDAGSGEALAGATIRVVGSQAGTMTRADGTYRLTLPVGTHQVRATFLGYAARTEAVTLTVAGVAATRNFALTRTGIALDQVVVTGSRRVDRTVVEAPAPVDVFSAEDIAQTGLTETSQIIQMLAPSFNFPRPSVNDGTDHIRPATLRGLGPDQVLVLLNGKRRHNTALVHVNQSVGRGSTSVDFNAIPANAIERIEILRDGAAAQYGSDAIAGVINIILKSSAGASVSGSVGQRYSSTYGTTTNGTAVTFGERDFRDGRVLQADANLGWSFRGDGFLHLSGEFRDRERTNRTRVDTSAQCLAGDTRCTNPRHHQSWAGDPETQDRIGFFNAALPLNNGMRVYGSGGVSVRDGLAAGFFRRSRDDRTLRAIHPNGFLPLIRSDILDGSGTVGVKGEARGWGWDLSGVYGMNAFEFFVDSSNNTSMGAASPTSFYAGAQRFNQATLNLDVARTFAGMRRPMTLAFGLEGRRDNYQLEKGDENSYRDGGVRILDGPNAGQPAPPFAQVFPGFRPVDEADQSRTNVGAYVDMETNLTSKLLVAAAARAENYSDFGSTVDGKLNGRFEPVKGFSVRGGVQTGFRAPSLAQSYFSAVSTNFINVGGVNTPFEIRTFAIGTPGATLLGATPLKPEQSLNWSAGLTIRPIENLSLTTDYYRVAIEDRIVLSGNFIHASVRQLLEQNGITGVSGARYFTNAIDTRTEGVDVVVQYGLNFGARGLLRLTGGHNQNTTKVTRVSATPPQLAAVSSALFDRVQRALFEVGQPRSNTSLAANYIWNRFNANVHTHRFGKVTEFAPATTGANDQTFSAKWVTDASLSYRFFDRLALSLGGNNIFDVYPDTVKSANQTRGIYPYDASSATWGINGAYFYVKAAYDLGNVIGPFRKESAAVRGRVRDD